MLSSINYCMRHRNKQTLADDRCLERRCQIFVHICQCVHGLRICILETAFCIMILYEQISGTGRGFTAAVGLMRHMILIPLAIIYPHPHKVCLQISNKQFTNVLTLGKLTKLSLVKKFTLMMLLSPRLNAEWKWRNNTQLEKIITNCGVTRRARGTF